MWDFEIDNEIYRLTVNRPIKNGSSETLFFMHTDLSIERRSEGYLEYLTGHPRFSRSKLAHNSIDLEEHNIHSEFNKKLNPKHQAIDHQWLTLFIDGNIVSNDRELTHTLVIYVETLKHKVIIEHFEKLLPFIYRNLSLTGSAYFVNKSGREKSHVLITRLV